MRIIEQFGFWNHPVILAGEEKKRIFHTANWIGGALLIGQLAASFVAAGYAVLLYLIGHLTPNGTSTHFADDELSYIFFSILMFVPFLAICVPLCKRRLSEVVRFEKHSKKLGASLVLMCLGVFLIGNWLTNLVYTLLNYLGHPPYMPETTSPENLLELGLVLLSSACIPALTEEFAFRGVILGLLRPYGKWFSIVISAVLFALMHGNLVQIPFALVCGIGLGYATLRTGSLWPAIIAHFINNAMSFGLEYLVSIVPQDTGDLLYYLWFLIMLFAGVLGLCLVVGYNRRHPEPSACEKEEVHYTTLSERVARVIASPTLILFGLFCVYSASQYIL